jgi:hypothetical protein
MRHELIQHIQDIQAQRKSGLLMAVAQVAESDGVIITSVSAHFSFFFREGQLATVLCRGSRGSAISKITAMTDITRVQFTETSASTISVDDKQVGTAELLEMLGAQAIPEAAIHEAQDRVDAGRALKSIGEKVFVQVFGGAGKAMLRGIGTRHDPIRDPAGFFDACVAELSPLVGPQSAKDMMSA